MKYEINFKTGKLEPLEEVFTELKRGQIIRWGGNMGYPAEDMIILEKIEYSDFVAYKVVNIERYKSDPEYIPFIHQVEATSIKETTDTTLWHNQHHFITDRTATEEQIKAILDLIPIREAEEKARKEAEIKSIKDAGLLTDGEKINLGTAEISKLIKTKLKTRFSACVFSVTKQSYSGGCSITITLKKANFKVFRDFEELSAEAINHYLDNGFRTIEQLKALCVERYAQLNHYSAKDEYESDKWNNGHFLTEEAHNTLKIASEIANYYNFDHSDPMTDYFNVNFYLHLNIDLKDVKP